MTGRLQKRSMRVNGHRTSIALEPEFWEALEHLAHQEGCLLGVLLAGVDARRGDTPLASALRVHVLKCVTARQPRP
jgi:predicted DNA-binding ribbon-helix-helix protein